MLLKLYYFFFFFFFFFNDTATTEIYTLSLHDALPILLDRFDYWQAGYVIPKGAYPELRAEGIDSLRRSFAELIPEFADRVGHLEDWRQASLLSVESSRCPRWYRPGLLLIGDAAHVMSPVGGVGINYAIQDAVTAA